MRRSASVLFLALAYPACTQEPANPPLDAILRRHIGSLGNEAQVRSSDLYYWARATTGGQEYRVRILVRREPFAYREEWIPLAGPAQTFVSDGRHAWVPTHLLTGPVRPGTPLAGPDAIRVLEHAFCDGFLYLDRRRIQGSANFDARGKLGLVRELPEAIERGNAVDQVHFTTPAGTLILCMFDAKDGRLLEIAQPEVEPTWFMRFGRWKRFGELWLPTLRVGGRLDPKVQPTLDVMEIEEVRADLKHPEALFAGTPAQPLPAILDAGPLRPLPHTTPGSGHLLLPKVRLGSQTGVGMLVDTGADSCVVTPRLADAQHLLPLGRNRFSTASGETQARRRWLGELEFGDRRVLQLPAMCIELPPLFELPPDERPGLVLGGAELLASSPVFDLAGERLWLRGRPVTPLARLSSQASSLGAGESRPNDRVVTIPFAEPRKDHHTVLVEIEIAGKRLQALLDTGFPTALRLHYEALVHFGLPTQRSAWLQRGALPTGSSAVGGAATEDLQVTLPEFRLGNVVYERPVVQISFVQGLGKSRPIHAIVGFGAFFAFRRAGLDDERQLFEVELGPEVQRDQDGTWRVPSPGIPLGLAVGSPLAGATGWPGAFPGIQEVSAGSPAARAGLEPGQRVLAIDGKSCEHRPAWSWNRSLWVRAGSSVEVKVRGADGVERTVKLP